MATLTASVIIVWLVIGLVIGGLARLLVPGRQHIGLILTILIGIVAALLGGIITTAILGAGHTVIRSSSRWSPRRCWSAPLPPAATGGTARAGRAGAGGGRQLVRLAAAGDAARGGIAPAALVAGRRRGWPQVLLRRLRARAFQR